MFELNLGGGVFFYREQRVTAFVVALLIGLSLLLTPVLKV